jgi:hypothetical protein
MRFLTTAIILLLLFNAQYCLAQSTPNQTLNLSFEKANDSGRIAGVNYSTGRDDYFSYKDDGVKKEGNNSLRLEKNDSSKKGGFGVFTFFLPANFKGTELTLKGYIKTEKVADGYAGLWLRSDAGKETIGFNNMSEEGVSGTEDWAQHTITVPMNDDVTAIFFGGLLIGKGKSWFDKLELFVDGKSVESISWIPGKVTPEKKDLIASGVTINPKLNDQQVENLYVLGKVWGFLKYHHPEVAKGNYNFDSCLFNVLPKLLNANSNGRDEALLAWINTLGNENTYPEIIAFDTNYVHTQPELAWLSDKRFFSTTLSDRLINIYKHRNKGKNYYVRLAPGVQNPIFDTEPDYKTVAAEDDGFRMLGLFRYWNMIEYFFPYRHLIKENWSNVLKEFVPAFASGRSALDYRLACLRLINRVGDTHASIYSDVMLQDYFGKNSSALAFKVLDKKIIVSGYLSDSLGNLETLKPGDEIITVNNKSIAELRKVAEPYLCASNESVADRNFIDRFLFKNNDDSLMITYKRDGKTAKTALHLYSPGKAPYQNGDNWKMPMYKLLSPDIGYISLGKIRTDSLPQIFKTFENTKGIVIDIRNYPSQFMPFAMGEYLKSSSSPFVKFTHGSINDPGLFTYTTTTSNGPQGKSKVKTDKARQNTRLWH